ncbi:unnamed protein product [Linum trigynum]|uniref:Uncharacterized protein n=1 Tax=Linum trigynum TaxID=586398 RepID=A0AAV2GCN6_9ROSI
MRARAVGVAAGETWRRRPAGLPDITARAGDAAEAGEAALGAAGAGAATAAVDVVESADEEVTSRWAATPVVASTVETPALVMSFTGSKLPFRHRWVCAAPSEQTKVEGVACLPRNPRPPDLGQGVQQKPLFQLGRADGTTSLDGSRIMDRWVEKSGMKFGRGREGEKKFDGLALGQERQQSRPRIKNKGLAAHGPILGPFMSCLTWAPLCSMESNPIAGQDLSSGPHLQGGSESNMSYVLNKVGLKKNGFNELVSGLSRRYQPHAIGEAE